MSNKCVMTEEQIFEIAVKYSFSYYDIKDFINNIREFYKGNIEVVILEATEKSYTLSEMRDILYSREMAKKTF